MNDITHMIHTHSTRGPDVRAALWRCCCAYTARVRTDVGRSKDGSAQLKAFQREAEQVQGRIREMQGLRSKLRELHDASNLAALPAEQPLLQEMEVRTASQCTLWLKPGLAGWQTC